ncbi:MAG: metal-dependent hydrolase [Acidobacteriota bacterium]
MDPLTHTFLGGALAESGLKRRSALATATLMLGANLPDVDVLSYVWGSDAALGFRRGWTHGVLAMVVWPFVLTLLMLAVDRWLRRRRSDPGPPADPRQLLLLYAVAIWSHPLLDWLNTYGVRVLMPFRGDWFYGDALFIIDPWVWLMLGGVLFLAHSTSRRALVAWAVLGALLTAVVWLGSGPFPWARFVWLAAVAGLVVARRFELTDARRRALARSALAAAALYAAGMVALTGWTAERVRGALDDAGIVAVGPLMVGPDRIDSLARRVVVPAEGAYRFGSYHPLREPAWRLEAERPLLASDGIRVDASELVERARGAHCVHGMVNWLRYPFYEVDPEPDGGATVYLLDARYTRDRATRGIGGAAVQLPADGEPLCAVER